MNAIKLAVVVVVSIGGYLVYSLSSEPSTDLTNDINPLVEKNDRISDSVSPRAQLNSSNRQHVAIQSNQPEFDLSEYTQSELVLEQLSYTEIPLERRGSIGEIVDPDDQNYQHTITIAASIGEVLDPDDESYLPVITKSGSIGEVIDPDDEGYSFEINNPGFIGEVIDPDDFL